MRRTASRQGARSFISIRGPRYWRRPQSSFPLAPQLRINGNIQTVSSPADPSAMAKPRWPVVKRCRGVFFVSHFIQFFSAILQLAEHHKQRLPFRCVKVSDKKRGKTPQRTDVHCSLPYLREKKRSQTLPTGKWNC